MSRVHLTRKSVWAASLATIAAAALIATVAVAWPSSSSEPLAAPQGHKAIVATASFESPISATDQSLGTKLADYADGTRAASAATTKRLIAKAAIKDMTVTKSGQTLDRNRAFTRETDNGSFVLRIPFVNRPNLLDISGYTVMFNPDGSVFSRGEVVYEQRTAHSGRVALWQDGKRITDQIVTDRTPSQAGGGDAQPAFNWDTLNKCLTSAGIAQWAIIAIGIACGVVCGATLGIGCAACIVAAGGVIGTTAGTCVARAMST